ncbi:MAG: hypothetical protein IKE53_08045 [Clostridiales bacterium]|nr:hypothetical protein [Clostridiales bacterium]
MDFEYAYGNLKILEIEVRSYADEGYKVRYDFDRGLISWRDYYMWNNNFMKSLTDSKLEILDSKLPESHILEGLVKMEEGRAKKKDTLERPGKWEISVELMDGSRYKFKNEEIFPAEWIELRSIVESTTECTFRLH